MKKKVVIAVVVIAALVITAFAMHFISSQNDIPNKELVYQQLQLDGKDEDFVMSQFEGCTKEKLVQKLKRFWDIPYSIKTGQFSC